MFRLGGFAAQCNYVSGRFGVYLGDDDLGSLSFVCLLWSLYFQVAVGATRYPSLPSTMSMIANCSVSLLGRKSLRKSRV